MVKEQDHSIGNSTDFPLPAPELNVDRESLANDISRVPDSIRGPFQELMSLLDVIEELSDLGREIQLGHSNAGLDFDELLDDQMGCMDIPARAEAFSFSAYGPNQPNNPPTPILPQLPFRPPCLLPPSLFGNFTNGLLRRLFPMESPNDAARVDDELWRGLWTVFSLSDQLRPLEWLFNAGRRLDAGHITTERFERIAGSAVGMCGAPSMHAIQPTSGSFPFPIPNFGPRLFFPCRIDQRNETERAIRCFCIETYHIERIVNCSPGREASDFACIGDCIDIFGEGFDDDRVWDHSVRMSEVLFPTESGTPVAASEFLPIPADGDDPEIPSGWSNNRIRVRVPPTAIPGDIEVRILCQRTNRGRVIDPSFCRYPTRLRTRTSEPYFRVVGPLSISFSVTTADGEFAESGDGGTTGVLAESCTAVAFQIETINAEFVTLTDEAGAEVDIVDIDPSVSRVRANFSRSDTLSKSFSLTVVSSCLDSPVVRTISVAREHRVHVEPADASLVSGASSTIRVRVSCPLETDGIVSVSLDRSFHGVTLPGGSDIPIPAGSTQSADIPIATSPVLCGAALLIGELTSGSSHPHRNGTALIDIIPIDVATTLTITGRAEIRPAILDRTSVSSPVLGPFPAVFSADRTQVTLIFPGSIHIFPITIRPSPSTIVAAYNGTFSSINFTLTGEVGAPLPFSGSPVSIDLSSTGDLRPEFGPLGSVGSAVTMATDGSGTVSFIVRVVGATTISDGTFSGTRIGLGLGLRFTIRPPRNCNLEPWFPP